MNCKNEVSYDVEIGRTMRYREIFIRCGNTDRQGESEIGEECRCNQKILESQLIHQAKGVTENEGNAHGGWGEM